MDVRSMAGNFSPGPAQAGARRAMETLCEIIDREASERRRPYSEMAQMLGAAMSRERWTADGMHPYGLARQVLVNVSGGAYRVNLHVVVDAIESIQDGAAAR
jgi:hypothetical protein